MELGHKHTIDEMKSERGFNMVPLMLGVAAMPVCALAGSYVCEGVGYLWGNLVDVIPYVNKVAPWLAERFGLISRVSNTANLNEDLYHLVKKYERK
jgi:hypothetical protein